MAFGDQDVALFFRDGVTVLMPDGTAGGAQLDWPEDVNRLGSRLTPGMVIANPTLTYSTGALNLKSDMLITVYAVEFGRWNPKRVQVAGTKYAVCHPRMMDDGKVTVAELNKVKQ